MCKTIYNQACELVPTTQFRTEVDNVCTTVPEKVCVPTTQTVPDQQCATHLEQSCTTEVHTTIDIALNEECQDIQHQVCHETRVAQHVELVGVQQHAELIGHQVAAPALVGGVAAPALLGGVAAPALAGIAGHGVVDTRFLAAQRQFAGPFAFGAGPVPAPGAFALGGVPVAGLPAHGIVKRDAESEPESEARDGKQLLLSRLGAAPIVGPAPFAAAPAAVAIAPRCEVKVERVCRKVPVQVPRTVEVPKCVQVPRTECVATTRVVAGPPACHDEPRQVCNPVSKQVPFEVPVEQCHPVASQVCKDVPHKAARQVCKTGYVHGHGYGHGYGVHH